MLSRFYSESAMELMEVLYKAAWYHSVHSNLTLEHMERSRNNLSN